jgi:MoxR-like ATPase
MTEISLARKSILQMQEEMNKSIIGQEKIVERLVVALLANGNVLLEGLPGLAKTRAVNSMAKVLEAGLSRIQFTPDLLPADITGTEVYFATDKGGEFKFDPGPIFNNLILADEINRAPAKVQSALLEAMEERQVTVAGVTRKMSDLFMVLATQNPIEQEGTYPLPEAQMDRFLMHVYIDYPDKESELKVIRLVRAETGKDKPEEKPLTISQDAVFEARKEINKVYIAENVERYIIDLVTATRTPAPYSEELAGWIQVGASPRGSIGLDKCSRVYAWLKGKENVTPDDVREVAHDVLRHRIMLSYEANAAGVSSDDVIDRLLELVAIA